MKIYFRTFVLSDKNLLFFEFTVNLILDNLKEKKTQILIVSIDVEDILVLTISAGWFNIFH